MSRVVINLVDDDDSTPPTPPVKRGRDEDALPVPVSKKARSLVNAWIRENPLDVANLVLASVGANEAYFPTLVGLLRAKLVTIAASESNVIEKILTETLTEDAVRAAAVPVVDAEAVHAMARAGPPRVQWVQPAPGSPPVKAMPRRKCNLSDLAEGKKRELGLAFIDWIMPGVVDAKALASTLRKMVTNELTSDVLCRVLHHLVMVYLHLGNESRVNAILQLLPPTFTADVLLSHHMPAQVVRRILELRPDAMEHLDQPPVLGAGATPGSAGIDSVMARLASVFAMDDAFNTACDEFVKTIVVSSNGKPPLRDYQRDAMGWIYLRERIGLKLETDHGYLYPGGVIALEPGMGKTRTMLSAIYLLDRALTVQDGEGPGTRLPTLIIAPAGVLSEWIVEMNKFFHEAHRPHYFTWLGQDARKTLMDLHANKMLGRTYDIVLTTVQTFTQALSAPLLVLPYRRIIIDECQLFSNPSGERWLALRARLLDLAQAPLSVWGLSGTPFRNKPLDFVSQVFLTGYRPERDSIVRKKFYPPNTKKGGEWPPTVQTVSTHGFERFMRHIYLLKYGPETLELMPAVYHHEEHALDPQEEKLYHLISGNANSAENANAVFGNKLTGDAMANAAYRNGVRLKTSNYLRRAVVSFKLMPPACLRRLRQLQPKADTEAPLDAVSSRMRAMLTAINAILIKDSTAKIVVFSTWTPPLIMIEKALRAQHPDWTSGVNTGFFTGENSKQDKSYFSKARTGGGKKKTKSSGPTVIEVPSSEEEDDSSDEVVVLPAPPAHRIAPTLIPKPGPAARVKPPAPAPTEHKPRAKPAEPRERKPYVKKEPRSADVLYPLMEEQLHIMQQGLAEMRLHPDVRVFRGMGRAQGVLERLGRERVKTLGDGEIDERQADMLSRADDYIKEAVPFLALIGENATVTAMNPLVGEMLVHLQQLQQNEDESPAGAAARFALFTAMTALLDRVLLLVKERRKVLAKVNERRDALAEVNAGHRERHEEEEEDPLPEEEDEDPAMDEMLLAARDWMREATEIIEEDEAADSEPEEASDEASGSEEPDVAAASGDDEASGSEEPEDEDESTDARDEYSMEDEGIDDNSDAISFDEEDADANANPNRLMVAIWPEELVATPLSTFRVTAADKAAFALFQRVLGAIRDKLWFDPLDALHEPPVAVPFPPDSFSTHVLGSYLWHVMRAIGMHSLYIAAKHEHILVDNGSFRAVVPPRSFLLHVREVLIHYAAAVARGPKFKEGQDATLAEQLWRLFDTQDRFLLFYHDRTRLKLGNKTTTTGETAPHAMRLFALSAMGVNLFDDTMTVAEFRTHVHDAYKMTPAPAPAGDDPDGAARVALCWGLLTANDQHRFNSALWMRLASDYGNDRAYHALEWRTQDDFDLLHEPDDEAFYAYEWSEPGIMAFTLPAVTIHNTRNPDYLRRLSESLALAIGPLLAFVTTVEMEYTALAERIFTEQLAVWFPPLGKNVSLKDYVTLPTMEKLMQQAWLFFTPQERAQWLINYPQ